MLDGLDVIHMNGRIYDPTLGRFLQPDPIIQEPGNPQNWNAYSYVFNNPYKYTDPTGYLGQTERSWLGAIVAIAASVFTGGAAAGWWAASLTTGQLFAITVAAGFASGAIATKSFEGGLYGAFGAALSFGVGWAGATYNWGGGTIVAQAFSGGIVESLQGGNFGAGFVTAWVGAAVAPGLRNLGAVKRVVVAAIVGGTLSEITGGKFANGAASWAVSAAMVDDTTEVIGTASDLPIDKIRTTKVSGILERSALNAESGYSTENDAAIAQYNAYSGDYEAAGKDNEVMGVTFKRDGRHYFSTVMTVPKQFEATISLKGIRVTELSGYTHTHPDSSSFSGLDYKTPASNRLPYFVRNSRGQVYRWEVEGALRYASYVRGLQKSRSMQSQSADIKDHERWGISNICGGQPCVR
jgi:RHS repeat-associated protein